MSQYKGDSIVITGNSSHRDPYLAWTDTFHYAGLTAAIAALANAQPAGIDLDFQQTGAVAKVDLVNARDEFHDKWEIDREYLDKDMISSPAFISLSQNAKAEIKRWRANPDTVLWLDPTQDNPNFPAGSRIVSGDVTLMQNAEELILRGTESIQTSTLILKRIRKMSVNYAPSLVLSEQTSFYSTGALIAAEGDMQSQVGTLPVTPYAAPSNAQWGWLQRNQNRSFISRGFMEEHSDWVFAAWSTILYTYIPPP